MHMVLHIRAWKTRSRSGEGKGLAKRRKMIKTRKMKILWTMTNLILVEKVLIRMFLPVKILSFRDKEALLHQRTNQGMQGIQWKQSRTRLLVLLLRTNKTLRSLKTKTSCMHNKHLHLAQILWYRNRKHSESRLHSVLNFKGKFFNVHSP